VLELLFRLVVVSLGGRVGSHSVAGAGTAADSIEDEAAEGGRGEGVP